MTAFDIYKASSAYLSQTAEESDDLEPFVLPWLNVLLEECLPMENALRAFEGEAPLTAAPVLSQLTDTVPYRAALTKTALPYGLASDFFRDDDNDYRAADFRAKYVNAVNRALCAEAENITDSYA